MLPYISIHKLFKASALEFSEQAQRWMPEWLTQHPAVKSVKNTRLFKVFSVFGLNDFRQVIEDPAMVENFVDLLTNQFSRVVKELIRVPDSPEATQLEQVSYRLLQEIMKPAVWTGDKHRITAPITSDDKKFRIDAGTSVVKAYNAVKARAAKFGIVLPDLETTREFKEYSKRGRVTIVFSTNPEDIAAMSSRSEWGSCQTIETTKGLNACVVGSLMSKFIGICYITSGKQYEEGGVPRGETMMARVLVRFVVDTQTNKPAIYLDKMYPSYYPEFARMMVNAIQARTSVPVVDSARLSVEKEMGRYRLPAEKIPGLVEHEKSYIDEPEYFSTKIEEQDETIPVKNVQAFYMNYSDTIGALLGSSLATFLISELPEGSLVQAEANVLRTNAIEFARRLVRSAILPMITKVKKYYDKQFQGKWEPMKIGFIKKLMLKELSKPSIDEEVNSYIDYFLSREKDESNIFKNMVIRNNLRDAITQFIIDNITEIAKQVSL